MTSTNPFNNPLKKNSITVSDSASACVARPRKKKPNEELTAEQTADGAFRRQRNYFNARFGDEPGQIKPEKGRYRIIGAVGCGWYRRQRIVVRLLGLADAIPIEIAYGRDENGWKLEQTPGSAAEQFGFDRLNEFYRLTDPAYAVRGTSPAVIDTETGKVVTNNYHLLSLDLESAWRPFHKEGAPDLYPQALRQEIDLLNQQLFDDVNNGTYKVIFATNEHAARAAYEVFKARLFDYDFRLASRRYLFGDQLTDSDVRLFQTLESYESSYRPGIVDALGTDDVLHVWDYENLFAYARDLFQTPGFIDDIEKYTLGFTPDKNGNYIYADLVSGPSEATNKAHEEFYQAWLQPHHRETLSGSAYYSGPGGGGSFELWQFGKLN